MDSSTLAESPTIFWETAYRQHINKMIGVGYRYTANRQIAEDLAHDAFMIAYEKQSSFEGRGPFEAWLRRIVVNVCLQYIREQNKKKYLDAILQNDTTTMDTTDESTGKEFADLTEGELLSIVHQLPEHHKLVFNLYVIDQFSHAQIAKELGISEGTSKSHLARARKKIKALLQEKINQQQKKKSFFFLFAKTDSLYQKHFINYELPVQHTPSFDPSLYHILKPSLIKPTASLLAKFGSIGIASVLTATLIGSIIFFQKENKNKTIATVKNYPADTATNLQNGILYNDNKVVNQKKGNMKNVQSIGALMLAGSTLALPAQAQDSTKVEAVVATQVTAVAKPVVSVKTTARANPTTSVSISTDPQVSSVSSVSINSKPVINVSVNTDLSGTFYGEKLRWTAGDHELHFDGKSVITFGKNSFINSGTVSFLGAVYYLVVDGNPVLLDGKSKKEIKLTEKKYNLVQLSPATAIKKYGDAGKQGAIEISLAE